MQSARAHAEHNFRQPLTPTEFIAKWRDNSLSERAGAQAHFLDLCELLGVAKPGSPQTNDTYCFERGLSKIATLTGTGRGWADVWKKGCFAWEYKAPGVKLGPALAQLMRYALALDNPPLLVVSDRLHIEIHTHFTGTPSDVVTIPIDAIGTPENLARLKWLFEDPERFKPQRTRAAITIQAANLVGDLAWALQQRHYAPDAVARLLNKVLFCLFAESIQAPHGEPLLPQRLFSRLIGNGLKDPVRFRKQIDKLFQAMSEQDGEFGEHLIAWFNGGLFDGQVQPLPASPAFPALPASPLMPAPIMLTRDDVLKISHVAGLDWSAIDPSIFGTLFERGLNPAKRSQLGAHYTDPTSIMRIVQPVIIDPLIEQWQAVRAHIAAQVDIVHAAESSAKRSDKAKASAALTNANQAYQRFLERLENFRVLDPACGSGNFLYLALQSLKDIEHRVGLEVEVLGLVRNMIPHTGPHNVLGIELDPYAAELARVTIWIGEIQWMVKHGYEPSRNPILKNLNQIECRDALLAREGEHFVEAAWPVVDVIVGNPPFLGGSKKRGELGDATFAALAEVYAGRVPAGADLVCYWFDKAGAAIRAAGADFAGLVATNSIRGGANRAVLDLICQDLSIFNAFSDEAWVNEGAAVRVSIVNLRNLSDDLNPAPVLDGKPVAKIFPDLTGGAVTGVEDDVPESALQAKPLIENEGICFQGTSKKAKFEIDGALARSWLLSPNPHGKSNALVVRPWANGYSVAGRYADDWIIDFGTSLDEAGVAYFAKPFGYVVEHVKPVRAQNNRDTYRKYWWRHAEARPHLRAALVPHERYIVTVAHAKFRLFRWFAAAVCPDQALFAFARSDDVTFGILHSRFHEIWALRLGTSLEDRPRYTPSTCFDTFPFPESFTPSRTVPINGLASIAVEMSVHSASSGMLPESAQLRLPCNQALLNANEQAVARAIALAAWHLNRLREAWVNPPEWVDVVPEVVPGFPDRIVPKPEFAKAIKERTLTKLYNERPAWLVNAHAVLDIAVAEAYGWGADAAALPEAEILQRLLALNLARGAAAK